MLSFKFAGLLDTWYCHELVKVVVTCKCRAALKKAVLTLSKFVSAAI
jgi:hypothetical protein